MWSRRLFIVCFRHELAMALHQQEVVGAADSTSLQALQTPQHQREVQGTQSHDQHVGLMTSANQSHDTLGAGTSSLMTGVNQQYLTASNDDIDDNRGDTIIQDGQFSLNSQVCVLVLCCYCLPLVSADFTCVVLLQFVTGQTLGYGDGQTLSQNYIGSNQQSLNQLNYNQPYSIDLGALGSTNISNILQPRTSAVSVQQNTSAGAVEQTRQTYESQDMPDEIPAATPLNSISEENFTQKQNMVVLPERTSEDEAGAQSETSGNEEEEEEEEEEVEVEMAVGEENSNNVVEENEPDKPMEMGVGKRRYCCRHCNKKFNKASLLRAHMKAHTGNLISALLNPRR